jgi:predicted Fe-Mo cluster-binding NifX family protein
MIAVPVKDKGDNPLIDERFGRASIFCLIDDKGKWRFIDSDSDSSASGAGVKTVKMLIDEGLSVVISPEIGPQAMDVIEQLGIKVFNTGSIDNLKEALTLYGENKLVERKTGPAAGGLRRA